MGRVRIVLFAWFPTPPEPGDNTPEMNDAGPEGDDLFDYRLEQFVKLGFDYLTALELAWNQVSPSEVRIRWDGAPRETVAHYFLGDE